MAGHSLLVTPEPKLIYFLFAEVKNFCLALFVTPKLQHNRITKVEPAFCRPLVLQILLLVAVFYRSLKLSIKN